MTVTKKDLARELKSLGQTPVGIARKLTKEGARGRTGDSDSCPVAQHLKAAFPDEVDVHVQVGYVTVNGATIKPLPPVVRTFVDAFDNNEHPQLIKHSDTCGGVRMNAYPRDRQWFVECDCSAVDYEWDNYLGTTTGLGKRARVYFLKAKAGWDAQFAQ